MQANATAPTYSKEWEQVHSAFLVIIIVAALFGNGFVCMAVYRVHRLQKVSNYFLVSLAVSDILFVLFALPFRIYFGLNHEWLLGKHTCQFWIFVDLLCCSASIVNLALVSVDRYVALSRPLRYLVLMTVRRCKIGIASVWLFSFTISLFSVHTWTEGGYLQYHPVCRKHDKIYYTVTTILAIVVPLVVLMVLYCLVFKMALEQAKKIERSYIVDDSLRSQGSITGENDALRGQHSRRRHCVIREMKATKTLIVVVGTFFICWIPLIVILLIQQHSPSYIDRLPSKIQEILGQLFLYTLPQLNSALNPYIYTFFNSEFRKVFKKTFEKILPFFMSKSAANEKRKQKRLLQSHLKQ